ncbi:hypothetical protein KOAAANKH_00702 [Brevundimonas sp. NIBR10]|uniref:hypothetical protein n=1 Tax=Brevundimonas sp. NIBR10 TaxID=3015997 RepID=UPI0022F1ADFC|nr:hypothetical protein [Brevundimonas sp. NIBR10]WGM45838.1 hypothetical protein KOAAANKH_00702 [Brevundimonas sp. NIBR10]
MTFDSAAAAPPSEPTPGERWISFLRAYGPVNKVEGMYAETIATHSKRHRIPALQFEHPRRTHLEELLNPAAGQLTNLILTGTAGDGKTSLCHFLWDRFGGSNVRSTGADRGNYLPLDVETPDGVRRLHFIFEFSGWAPAAGQAWPDDKLDLLRRLVAAVKGEGDGERFIIAANDGKLVQVFDRPPADIGAEALGVAIGELLTTERERTSDFELSLIDLSRMKTADIFDRALTCLLERDEWRCFVDEADDPAFGPASPLRKNYDLLKDTRVRSRLMDLTSLLDANGLHISIREVLLLLVNALLGWPGASDGVASVADLRHVVAAGLTHECALYSNIFGSNLKSDRRREQYAVFRHLAGFRVGQETTNTLDSLIIFGAQDERLKAKHDEWLVADPFYGASAEFERLRDAYLENEDDGEGRPAFMEALVRERRRLFFRLPPGGGVYDPWRLSVFQAAGDFQRDVLVPLAAERDVDLGVVHDLVRGLNRVWTGMLVGETDRLHLTTGLDLTTAPISSIVLYAVPVRGSLNGEEVAIVRDAEGRPTLRVTLRENRTPLDFRLTLVRYEFLTRVAQGALPGSFSKECNEDVLAFKSQVLGQFYDISKDKPRPLFILELGANGAVMPRQLSVMM